MRSFLAAVGAAFLLVACGGGGSDAGSGSGGYNSSEASAKYVGTWTSTCLDNGAGGTFVSRAAITRRDASSMSISVTYTEYSTSNCTGTPASSSSDSSIATVVGQTTVGGQTVDKLDSVWTGSSTPDKDIALIQNDRLYFGGGSRDSSGYPTSIDYSQYFTKGSGGTTTEASAKYVGTWQSNCISGSTASLNARVVVSRVSATAISSNMVIYSYTNASCSGTGTVYDTSSSTDTIVGQTTVSGTTVDKILSADGTKDISVIQSGRLYFGDDSALDSSGYPTSIDYTLYFTKV